MIMEMTSNYSLRKPSGSDAPDIEIINHNMEIVDEKLKESMDQVELGSPITE